MHHTHATDPSADAATPRDFSLDGGCILCGGDLAVRVSPGRARTVCKVCRWISRPHMRQDEDGVHVVHHGLVA